MQLNFRFPSPQTGQVPAGQASNANPQFQNTNLLYPGLSYPTFNQVPAQFTNPINYAQQAQLLSPPISAFFPFNSLPNSNPALYTANLQLQQTILQNPAQAFIAQPQLAIPVQAQTAQVAQSLNFVPAYNQPANASSLQGNTLLSLPTAKHNFMESIEQLLLNSTNAAPPVTLPQIPSLPAPISSTSSNKRAAQPQSQAQPQHSSQSQPLHHHQQPQSHHLQQPSTAVPLSNPHLDFTLAAERAANAVLLHAIPKDTRTSTIQHLPAALLPQPLPKPLTRPQPQPLPEPQAPLQQQAPLPQPTPILQHQTQPPVAARVAQPIPVPTTIARPVTTTTLVPPILNVSTVVSSAPSAPHTTGGSLTIRVPLNAVAAFNSAASVSTITPVTTLPSSPIRSPPAASPPQNAPFPVSSVTLAPSFSIGSPSLPSTMASSTTQQLQQQQPTRSIASSSAPVPPKYRHAKPVPMPGSPKGGAGGSSRSRKKCNELEALSKWQVKDAAYIESAETPATYTSISAEPEVDLVDRVKRPRRAALSAQTALQLASFPRAISDDTSSTVVAKRSGLLITVTF